MTDETKTAAPATPDAETKTAAANAEPVFLGLPRHAWKQLTANAYAAEQRAQAAAAEAEEADARLAGLREKLDADKKRLADAEEDATLARNAATRARENFDRAASREEREEWKQKIPELEAKADELARRVKDIRNEIEAGQNATAIWNGQAVTKRGNAFNFRKAADAAAAKAQQVEIPEIRAALAAAERREIAAKEADALRATREHLPRVCCRDCRFWEPIGGDPTQGQCHYGPPTNLVGVAVCEPPIVHAANWCAKGEALPAADKSRKAAPVLA